MTHGGYRGEPTASSRADPFGADPFDPFTSGAIGAPETPATQQQETHTLATLSVVFAFVFAPAGVILGHLALSQIHQTGQRGRDRALVHPREDGATTDRRARDRFASRPLLAPRS